jgi:hypothetical protein
MDRRQLLRSTSAFAGAALFAPMMRALDGVAPASALVLTGAQERWQKTYDSALAVLAGNVKQVPGYDRPVLVEGAVYPGVWLECGPHESYV